VVEDAIVEGVRELRIRSSRGMSRDHIFVNVHQHQSVLKPLLGNVPFFERDSFRVFHELLYNTLIQRKRETTRSLFLSLSLSLSLFVSSLIEEENDDDDDFFYY